MKNNFGGKRLLTVKETAKFISRSPSSIYNGISRKAKYKFPVRPIRIGKSDRFDIRDLIAYIEEHKNKTE